MGKGIYNRGFLPHWDFDGSLQAITFRLADSLPKQVIEKWNLELSSVDDEKLRQQQLRVRISNVCVAYIRNNPVKAGLCAAPEDWEFSSAGSQWNGEAGAPPSVGPEDEDAG